MESLILVYSPRHQAFADDVTKRVKALGWKVATQDAVAVLVIADAQSWECEGLKAACEPWRLQLGPGRMLILWVSSWAPLPATLPPGGGIKAWTGGILSASEQNGVSRFLARCAEAEERKRKEITTSVAMPVPESPADLEGTMDEFAAAAEEEEEPRTRGSEVFGPPAIPPAPVLAPLPVPLPAPRTPAPTFRSAGAGPARKSAAMPDRQREPAPSIGEVETGTEPVAAAPAAAPSELPSNRRNREVRTSVYCPETLAKGRWFTMQVWLHFPEQGEEVRALALESGHGQQAGRKAGLKIAPGALAGFSLIPEVLHTKRGLFGQRQPVHRYAQWNEEATNVEFPVCCPKSHRDEVLHETIEISLEGIPIGSCTVKLAFDRKGEMETEFSKIQTAFASYSSRDREQVIGRLQILAATVGVEPFFDVDSLRMGEDWEQRLKREVPTKDRFLLFWSENARKSEWVEREWRLALKERGLDYILPVPIHPAAPPKELRKLQFSDRYARMAEYERLKRGIG